MAKSTTANERVHQELRGDILAGRLRPGERLPFAALCQRYNASVGVVREALSRLVEQGLVLAEPNQGFRVTTISRTDLIQLTELRVELEAMALRRAIHEGDIQWESEILSVHHRLERTPMLDPDDPARFNEDWAIVHGEFHRTILAACSNTRMRNIADGLRDAAELYRRWSLPLGHGQSRDVADEHRALVRHVIAHETDKAVQVLIDHIQLTTDLLLASDIFEDPAFSNAQAS
jgi:DNA-binding GntR family transcriptional regulator